MCLFRSTKPARLLKANETFFDIHPRPAWRWCDYWALRQLLLSVCRRALRRPSRRKFQISSLIINDFPRQAASWFAWFMGRFAYITNHMRAAHHYHHIQQLLSCLRDSRLFWCKLIEPLFPITSFLALSPISSPISSTPPRNCGFVMKIKRQTSFGGAPREKKNQ